MIRPSSLRRLIPRALFMLFIIASERFPFIWCGWFWKLLRKDVSLTFNQGTSKAMGSVHDRAIRVENDGVFKVGSKDPFDSAGNVTNCRFMAIPKPNVDVDPGERVDLNRSTRQRCGEFPQAIHIPRSPEAICLDGVPLTLRLHILVKIASTYVESVPG